MLSGMRSFSQPESKTDASIKSLPDVYDRLATQITSMEDLNQRTRKSVT